MKLTWSVGKVVHLLLLRQLDLDLGDHRVVRLHLLHDLLDEADVV